MTIIYIIFKQILISPLIRQMLALNTVLYMYIFFILYLSWPFQFICFFNRALIKNLIRNLPIIRFSHVKISVWRGGKCQEGEGSCCSPEREKYRFIKRRKKRMWFILSIGKMEGRKSLGQILHHFNCSFYCMVILLLIIYGNIVWHLTKSAKNAGFEWFVWLWNI